MRDYQTIKTHRVDTVNGPLDVSFPSGRSVNINTPSSSLNYPELQMRYRGQGYIINVTLWANEKGEFYLPATSGPDYREGSHHINIRKATMGGSDYPAPTHKAALLQLAMAALTTVLGTTPFILIDAERVRVNNELRKQEETLAQQEAALAATREHITTLETLATSLNMQLMSEAIKPSQPLTPGVVLTPVGSVIE